MPEMVGLYNIMRIIAVNEKLFLKPTSFARICCFPEGFGFLRACIGVKEKPSTWEGMLY